LYETKTDTAICAVRQFRLPLFDIVNGFLNRCRGAWIVWFAFGQMRASCASQQDQSNDYLAEIFLHAYPNAAFMQACR
jgi:hypothetical protein